jgi:hypothetical protein
MRQSTLFVSAAVIALGAAWPSSARQANVGADGDACSIETPDGSTIPGKVKGLECCRVSDPDDCVVILKPMPNSVLQQPDTTRQPTIIRPGDAFQPRAIQN